MSFATPSMTRSTGNNGSDVRSMTPSIDYKNGFSIPMLENNVVNMDAVVELVDRTSSKRLDVIRMHVEPVEATRKDIYTDHFEDDFSMDDYGSIAKEMIRMNRVVRTPRSTENTKCATQIPNRSEVDQKLGEMRNLKAEIDKRMNSMSGKENSSHELDANMVTNALTSHAREINKLRAESNKSKVSEALSSHATVINKLCAESKRSASNIQEITTMKNDLKKIKNEIKSSEDKNNVVRVNQRRLNDEVAIGLDSHTRCLKEVCGAVSSAKKQLSTVDKSLNQHRNSLLEVGIGLETHHKQLHSELATGKQVRNMSEEIDRIKQKISDWDKNVKKQGSDISVSVLKSSTAKR